MTRNTLRFFFASTLALSLTSIACNPREPGTSATDTETGTGTDTTTMGMTATSLPTTSMGTTNDTGTGTDSATGTTAVTATSSDTTVDPTTGSSCSDPEDQPINSECTDPSGCGCDNDKCFVVPALGGFCGECLVDADCDSGGCTVPNPIAGVGATCNEGMMGQGCMTDAVCTGTPEYGTCGVLLEVPGIITVATCGQCKVNADCAAHPNGTNCTPTYDVENFSGQLECVADGSVDNNMGCSLEDNNGVPFGNNACKSGFCGEASVMGLLKLGVCGECNADTDCPMGQQCTDPAVDLDNGVLVGSVCM